ncbi:MAG: hypothetical protein WB615_16310 [Candidatus Tumulicola sp.]
MKVFGFSVGAVVLTLAVAASIVFTAQGAADPAKAFGAAWSPALGAWLPDPEIGFDAWSKNQTTIVSQYDYFICGSTRTPTEPKQSFYYAGSACPQVKNGTFFVYGTAEPIKGYVVYDRAHRIVLYNKGCCAWRGYALTAGVAKPPKTVGNADLSGVHTARGVTLGMTATQVERIYGTARPHATKGQPGLTTLSYTTMKGSPTKPGGDACGQFQSFTFRQDRLVSIELLVGC